MVRTSPRARIGTKKLAMFATVLAVVIPSCFIDWFAVQQRIPLWVYLQSELVVLIGLEIAYGVALLASGAAVPVLSYLWLAARRRGQARPLIARWLMCATSIVIGLLAAEAAILIRENRLARTKVTLAPLAPQESRKSAAGRLPPSREKIDLRERFPDKSAGEEFDLVVLGESSAEGVPFQKWLSIGKIVKWQIEKAIPGLNVRLTILARSGDTLEKQHEALAGLNRRPELLIVYCGHNEFFSRFFAFSDLPYYFLDQRPSGWDRLVENAERLSPLCSLIRRSADKRRIALPPPPIERDLVDVPVYLHEEYPRLLADFRRRLEEIVSYASELGALPILISPPGNDADFEPNRSFLPAEAPRHERESFRRAFLEARRMEEVDPSNSVNRYRELLSRQPGFAETHYRLATLLRRAGAWDEAYRHFVAARDCDGYPMRCLTSFQEVYREVASRHDCIYIDGQSYFHAIGRNGLLDDELFQDAMHPSLRGQIALAQAVVLALQARQACNWPANSPAPVIDPTACAMHFGIGHEAWDHAAKWGRGFYALVGRLRYDHRERSRRIDEAGRAIDRIEAGAAPESLGLVNVGLPAPVPVVSGEARGARSGRVLAH
jgi:hypothetical protein